MKRSRTATLLAAYYVVIAAVLLVRVATRVGPQVLERLGPSGELVLEWLLWIALLALPLGLLLRARGDAADDLRGPTAAERLRHLQPLALLVASDIAFSRAHAPAATASRSTTCASTTTGTSTMR